MISEINDYETELLSMDERKWRFGCWFQDYPMDGILQSFRSLPLVDLFERGLRFEGRARFGTVEFKDFLSRFSDPTVHRPEGLTANFIAHASDRFNLDDTNDFTRLCTVRATIVDVSVQALCKSVVSNQTM